MVGFYFDAHAGQFVSEDDVLKKIVTTIHPEGGCFFGGWSAGLNHGIWVILAGKDDGNL